MDNMQVYKYEFVGLHLQLSVKTHKTKMMIKTKLKSANESINYKK